jgi:hypothetical protein
VKPAMISAVGRTLGQLDVSTVRCAPDGRGFLADLVDDGLALPFFTDVDSTITIFDEA